MPDLLPQMIMGAARSLLLVIEVAPAGTLVGLIKRAVPSIEQAALKSPADIDVIRAFADSHGGK